MNFITDFIWFVKTLFTTKPQCDAQPKYVTVSHFVKKNYTLMWCGYLVNRLGDESPSKSPQVNTILNHEKIHMAQAYAISKKSYIPYYLKYLWEWLKQNPLLHGLVAYYLNPYECEAYIKQNDMNYIQKRQPHFIDYYKLPNAWKEFKNKNKDINNFYNSLHQSIFVNQTINGDI